MINFKDYLKEQLILETPLPDDFSPEKFNNNIPFKTKIEYALSKAKKVGEGSSRVAFEIEYKGRPTILKVAKNNAGLAQNDEETKILGDARIKGISIPIIDYDTENNLPSWIHVEKAEPATENQLCKYMCVPDLNTLVLLAKAESYRSKEIYLTRIRDFNGDNKAKIKIATQYAEKLEDLINYFDVELDDLARWKNWGFYKDKPVVIDIGFTYYTKMKYYTK